MESNNRAQKEKRAIKLSPEQSEMLRLAETDFEAGEKGVSAEKVLEEARAKAKGCPQKGQRSA